MPAADVGVASHREAIASIIYFYYQHSRFYWGNFYIGSSGQWSFSHPGIHPVAVRVTDRQGLFADASFKVEAVPEPSSTLGLLAFGAFGVGSLVKRFWQQKEADSQDS